MVNKSPQITPSDMCLESEPSNSGLCTIYNLYYFPLICLVWKQINHYKSWLVLIFIYSDGFLFPKHLFHPSTPQVPWLCRLFHALQHICLVKVVSERDIDCQGAISDEQPVSPCSTRSHCCWLGSKRREITGADFRSHSRED